MLPAAQRVRTADEHRLVARRGRRGSDGPLTAVLLPPAVASPPPAAEAGAAVPATAESRAAVVVPKAVGTAVIRNQVRRRLRHLLAAALPDLPPGSAVVIRVVPPAAGLSSRLLGEHLRAALTRAERRRPGRGVA